RTPSVRPTLPRHRQRSHEGVADRLCAEPRTGSVGARCVHSGLRLRTVPAKAQTMSAKTADRYFFVNWYLGKGGHLRVTTRECLSHEVATAVAAKAVLNLFEDSGELTEDFEVFVGSRAALDRHIAARGAR